MDTVSPESGIDGFLDFDADGRTRVPAISALSRLSSASITPDLLRGFFCFNSLHQLASKESPTSASSSALNSSSNVSPAVS